MSDAATEIADSPSSTPISSSKSLGTWPSPLSHSISLDRFELDSIPSRPGSPSFSSPLIQSGDATASNEPTRFEFGPPLKSPSKSTMKNKERLEDVAKMLGPEIDMKKPHKFRTRSEYLLHQKLKAMMDEMASANDGASPQPSFDSLSSFLQSAGDHAFVDAALPRLDFMCLMALDPALAIARLKKRRRLITRIVLGGLFDRENMYYSGPYSLLYINVVVFMVILKFPWTKDHDLRARVVFHVGTAVIHAICGRWKHEVLDWRLRQLRRGNVIALALCAMMAGHLVQAYLQYTRLAEYRGGWQERWARQDERSL
ncbi:hypothetical protein D9619_001119 [Psilocybe cf. subviscida]|uniref:Uncharacterized protein n=1 Tax=Psilocybe cf. subviscida TaxID=2480587 RepID=A0A8H5BFW2_9AGAR|nr:hypothetical protein D9619_001119 [Psilocybe cf. subviscida]